MAPVPSADAAQPGAGLPRPTRAALRARSMTLPIGLSDPGWLWLAVPAVAIVVVGWLGASGTLPMGRRVALLVIRVVLVAWLVLSLVGARLSLLSDRLSVVFLLDVSA